MFAFPVALRYLFSKKSHNAVNVISVISMLGVAVATMAIVCVLSVFNGFTDLTSGRTSITNPQLKILPTQGKVITNADSIASQLNSLSEVGLALPTINEHALAMLNGVQLAVNVTGVPQGYEQIVCFDQMIVDGVYATSESEAPIATLSVGTAIRLRAYPGIETPLQLYVPKRTGRINVANPMASFRVDSLFVGGVYQTNNAETDAQSLIVPIEIARHLLEYNQLEASAIEVASAPGVSDENLIAAVSQKLGSGYNILNRLQQESETFKMISVEKWITFVMLAFIFVIASFNVVSTLSMLIIEKRDNMATMRAMGATPATIRNIFLWEGWLISVVGGFIGVVLGVSLSLAQQFGGFIRLNADPSQLAIESYPVKVLPEDIVIVILLVASVGFIVGWMTSRFAARSQHS